MPCLAALSSAAGAIIRKPSVVNACTVLFVVLSAVFGCVFALSMCITCVCVPLCLRPRRDRHWNSSRRYGQLCNGDHTGGTLYSPPVAATLVGVAQVSCGSSFTCVLRLNGSVICFGWNSHGQCGLNPSVNQSVFLPPSTPVMEGVLQVSAGRQHTCALTNSPQPGSVYCWVSHMSNKITLSFCEFAASIHAYFVWHRRGEQKRSTPH